MHKSLLYAVLVTLAVLAPAAPAGAATALPGIYTTYGGEYRVSPAAFSPSGDGNFAFTGVRWIRLTATGGRATATEHRNDCRPTCAGGRFRTRAARLTFASVRVVAGRPLFTRFSDGLRWYDLPVRGAAGA
jgi:hypothetical protein